MSFNEDVTSNEQRPMVRQVTLEEAWDYYFDHPHGPFPESIWAHIHDMFDKDKAPPPIDDFDSPEE